MSSPRISYRMARMARNPGRRHLAGSDVTPKMQRQYEDILQSLRHYGRYRSDAKRKQVAAATVRKLAHHNPLNAEEHRAERLAEEFHGRPAREFIEVEEHEAYDEYGAVLGELERLDILMEDGHSFQSIQFDFVLGSDDNVLVVGDPDKQNIEFVGGDQDIPWREVEGASEAEKNLVIVGPVCEIDYFADKHHLEGPAEQQHGITYYHEFGDEGGELPTLLFDRRNTKLLLAGGDYTIEPEGITG
jgi:hypothetical protein